MPKAWKLNVSALVTSFVQLLDVGLWIGLNRISEYEPWMWVDNSQYAFNNWAPGEPTPNVRITTTYNSKHKQQPRFFSRLCVYETRYKRREES